MTARQSDLLVEALRGHLAKGKHPVLPEGSRPLWDAFCALSEARSFGAVGPNPIAWSEILAWMQLMRWPLEPHHIEVIRAMDNAWLAHAHGTREGGPAKPEVPLTATAFDAIFG